MAMTDKTPKNRPSLPEVMAHPFVTKDEEAASALVQREFAAIEETLNKLMAAEAEKKTAGGGGGGGGPVGKGELWCCSCLQAVSKEKFSKNQLKKKGEAAKKRKCSDCTARE